LPLDGTQNDVKLQSKKMVLNFSEQANNGEQKNSQQNKQNDSGSLTARPLTS